MSSTPSAQVVVDQWKQLNMIEFQRWFEEKAATMAGRQESAEESRRRLVEQSREFKQSATDDIRRGAAPLIKSFQLEIDALSRRATDAETDYFTAYRRISDVADPVPTLEASSQWQQKVQRLRDVEIEAENLRKTIDQYNEEFAEVKNQEVTIRQLKEKLKAYEEQLEATLQERVAEREAELQTAAARQAAEDATTRQMLADAQRRADTLQTALDAAQTALFTARSADDERSDARQQELQLAADDVERTAQRAEALERELESVKAKLADALPTTIGQGDAETEAALTEAQHRVTSLSVELAAKDKQLTQLLEEAKRLNGRLSDREVEYNKQLIALKTELKTAVEQLATANANLKLQANYEELKKQLSVLKSIEFGESEKDSSKSLEVLLLEKNKALQSENTVIKQRNAELEEIVRNKCRPQRATATAHKSATEDVDTATNTTTADRHLVSAVGRMIGEELVAFFNKDATADRSLQKQIKQAVRKTTSDPSAVAAVAAAALLTSATSGVCSSSLVGGSSVSPPAPSTPSAVVVDNRNRTAAATAARRQQSSAATTGVTPSPNSTAVPPPPCLTKPLRKSTIDCGELFDLDAALKKGMVRSMAENRAINDLQAIVARNVRSLGPKALNTTETAAHCRRLMCEHNLGQRLFAKVIMNQSQGSLSEILAKPRPWPRLTEKGREAFRRIFAWVTDEKAVRLLVALSPRRSGNVPGEFDVADADSLFENEEEENSETSKDYTTGTLNLKSADSVDVLVNHTSSTRQNGYAGADANNISATVDTVARAMAQPQESPPLPADVTPPPLQIDDNDGDDDIDLRVKIEQYSPPLLSAPPSLVPTLTQRSSNGAILQQQTGVTSSVSRWRHDDIPKEKVLEIYQRELEKLKEQEAILDSSMKGKATVAHTNIDCRGGRRATALISTTKDSPPPEDTSASSSTTTDAATPTPLTTKLNKIESSGCTDDGPWLSNSLISAVTAKPNLLPITQEQFDRYPAIDTEHLVKTVKGFLALNSISQRQFGECVLGLSQGSVSDMLARPKVWGQLTQKGREPFIRMQLFLEDESALVRLKARRAAYSTPVTSCQLTNNATVSSAAGGSLTVSEHPLPMLHPKPGLLLSNGCDKSRATTKARHHQRAAVVTTFAQSITTSSSPADEQEQTSPPLTAIDTTHVANKVKEALQQHGISQKVFGEMVVGCNQGTVSELVNKPKAFSALTYRCKEAYRRMQRWLDDPDRMLRFAGAITDGLTDGVSSFPLPVSTCDDDVDVNQPPQLAERSCKATKRSANEQTRSTAEPSAPSQPVTKARKFERTVIDDTQREALKFAFVHDPHPTSMTVQFLSQELGLSRRTVANWFHNYRTRHKDEVAAILAASNAAVGLGRSFAGGGLTITGTEQLHTEKHVKKEETDTVTHDCTSDNSIADDDTDRTSSATDVQWRNSLMQLISVCGVSETTDVSNAVTEDVVNSGGAQRKKPALVGAAKRKCGLDAAIARMKLKASAANGDG